MPNLPLANLISIKVVAWSLAGLVAAGGAVTAGTVAFTGSGTTNTGSPETGSPGTDVPATGSVGSAGTSATGSASVSASASSPALAGSSGNVSLTPMQLCTDLTSKVESVMGDAAGTVDKAGLSSVLANPAVSQVLSTAPLSTLVTTVNNATAVPDYCGLVLALPTVRCPVPSRSFRRPS